MSSRRPPRRAATLLAALVAAPSACLGLAATGPVAGASGSVGPVLMLDAQSEWVTGTSADPTFDLTLSVTDPPATASVEVVLYGQLHARSSLQRDAQTGPQGTPRTQAGPVPLSSLKADPHIAGAVDLDIPVITSPTGAPADGPDLSLQYAHPNSTATGVYPVSVLLTSPDGATVRSLTTFLTYVRGKSTFQLRFAMVVPISAPVDPVRPPTRGLPSTQAQAIETLITQLHDASGVPVTVEASPRTLQALEASGKNGRSAITTLAVTSKDQAADEIPAQPYVPVDLQTLGAAGEPTEIEAQMAAGALTLAQLRIDPESAGTSVWVATGAGTGLFQALHQIGEQRVVLPAEDLVTTQKTNRTPDASVFHLEDRTTAATPAAARADPGIASEFSDPTSDPALAASRLLADLAFIHFEAPNDTAVRGVVALPTARWRPTATFDGTVLGGLQGNPLLAPVTLSGFFTTVALGAAEPLRPTAATHSPTLRTAKTKLSQARKKLTAFDAAVTTTHPPAILAQLDFLLLCAEDTGTAPLRTANHLVVQGVRLFTQALHSQLDQVAFAGEQTVTLTARTGVIPVTLVRRLPYVVTGVLTVSGPKFTFPGKKSQTIHLDHPSNPWRVDVIARSSGDSRLHITFRSPTTSAGSLVITSATLTVRSTATSLVGVVLTAVALAVLLLWWARTWRSGRQRKRARETAGHPAGGT